MATSMTVAGSPLKISMQGHNDEPVRKAIDLYPREILRIAYLRYETRTSYILMNMDTHNFTLILKVAQ